MATVDFSRLPGFLDLVKEGANRGLTAAARTHSNFVRGSFSRTGRFTPSTPGTPPNVRRGFLRNGATFSASVNLRASSGIVRSVAYARIHELGGTIRARGKRLPVPLNAQAARLAEGGSLRRLDLFAFRSKRGAVILMGKDKKRVTTRVAGRSVSSSSVPVWVLKDVIRIPARPYLRPALANNRAAIFASAKAEAGRVIGRGARAAVRGGRR